MEYLVLTATAKSLQSVVSDSVRPHGPQPTRLLRPWDFPPANRNSIPNCGFSLSQERNFKPIGLEFPDQY